MSKLIAIDDGHGLETSGKETPDGLKENIFNHATKELLKKELIEQGFDVYDISPERTDTPLKTRSNRANDEDVDIFISIHFNALGSKWRKSGGGIETYHYLNSIEGKKLAECIHAEVIKGTKLTNRGVKEANFSVLRRTKMPAVLCEFGFMDIKEEADLMTNIAYQKECAVEITKGICKYFNITYKKKQEKQIRTLEKWEQEVIDICFENKIITNKKYWETIVKANNEAKATEILAMFKNLISNS